MVVVAVVEVLDVLVEEVDVVEVDVIEVVVGCLPVNSFAPANFVFMVPIFV